MALKGVERPSSHLLSNLFEDFRRNTHSPHSDPLNTQPSHRWPNETQFSVFFLSAAAGQAQLVEDLLRFGPPIPSLAVPASPTVGYLEMDGQLYGFADTQALHDFGTDPTPDHVWPSGRGQSRAKTAQGNFATLGTDHNRFP